MRISDWSSDVCSSDLVHKAEVPACCDEAHAIPRATVPDPVQVLQLVEGRRITRVPALVQQLEQIVHHVPRDPEMAREGEVKLHTLVLNGIDLLVPREDVRVVNVSTLDGECRGEHREAQDRKS